MHVLVDFLEPGSLALFDFSGAGRVHVWQQSEWTDVQSQEFGRPGQTPVSTDLDEPLTTLVNELPRRLAPLTQTGQGTLILVLRSCEAWDNFGGWQNPDGTHFEDRHGVLVLGGMAFCPEVQEGQNLEDVPIEYFVEQLCLKVAGKSYDQRIGNLQALPEYHLQVRADLNTRVKEMQARHNAAEKKAKVLLLEHLSEDQKAEFAEANHFHVQSKDGWTYRIVFKFSHNVFRIEDGRRTVEYCLVSESRIPIHDLMLMQKLMLETTPEEFHRVANSWPVKDDGEQVRRFFDLIPNRLI